MLFELLLFYCIPQISVSFVGCPVYKALSCCTSGDSSCAGQWRGIILQDEEHWPTYMPYIRPSRIYANILQDEEHWPIYLLLIRLSRIYALGL